MGIIWFFLFFDLGAAQVPFPYNSVNFVFVIFH